MPELCEICTANEPLTECADGRKLCHVCAMERLTYELRDEKEEESE